MSHTSALLFAVGGISAGGQYQAPRYLDVIGLGDLLVIFVILGGLILLCGYILSMIGNRRRRYPPDEHK